jgi:hypothetical protein
VKQTLMSTSLREMFIRHCVQNHDAMFVIAGVLLTALSFLSGCATIINGSSQKIEVSSLPAGARVMVDTATVGVTPLSIKIQRCGEHTIRVGLAGYEEAELTITSGMSAWVWGNLSFYVIFAPLGAIVDLISGGVYTFAADRLYVELSKVPLGGIGRPPDHAKAEFTSKENTP